MHGRTPKFILLAGGCGYIASYTAVVLQEAGHGVILVGNLPSSHCEVVDAIVRITSVQPQLYEVDCIDAVIMGRIFEHRKDEMEGVVYLTTRKAVGESIRQPLRYYDSNISSLTMFPRYTEWYGVQHPVSSSSCMVYGQPTAKHLSTTESAPRQDATSSYGNTKRINEDIITGSVRSGMSLQMAILRYLNPIGMHPSALTGEGPVGTPQNLIPFPTRTIAGLRKELVVFDNDYNTLGDTCIRDYIDVMDLAQAYPVALRHLYRNDVGPTPAHYIYNVGTGRGLSVLELIQVFERATGRTAPCHIDDRGAGDIEQIWTDTSCGEQELQQHAGVPIEENLRRTWYWQEALGRRHVN